MHCLKRIGISAVITILGSTSTFAVTTFGTGGMSIKNKVTVKPEETIRSVVVDPSTGIAFFSMSIDTSFDDPTTTIAEWNRVAAYDIKTNPPTRLGQSKLDVFTLDSFEEMAYDPANKQLYGFNGFSPTTVHKLSIPDPNGTFAHNGSFRLNSVGQHMFFDAANQILVVGGIDGIYKFAGGSGPLGSPLGFTSFGYMDSGTQVPGTATMVTFTSLKDGFQKFDYGVAGNPALVGNLAANQGGAIGYFAINDGGYGYFGDWDGIIQQVNLGAVGSGPTVIKKLDLRSEVGGFGFGAATGCASPGDGFIIVADQAPFGPTQVVKIETATLRVLGVLSLAPAESMHTGNSRSAMDSPRAQAIFIPASPTGGFNEPPTQFWILNTGGRATGSILGPDGTGIPTTSTYSSIYDPQFTGSIDASGEWVKFRSRKNKVSGTFRVNEVKFADNLVQQESLSTMVGFYFSNHTELDDTATTIGFGFTQPDKKNGSVIRFKNTTVPTPIPANVLAVIDPLKQSRDRNRANNTVPHVLSGAPAAPTTGTVALP